MISIITIENGFLVEDSNLSNKPVFFPSLEKAVEAILAIRGIAKSPGTPRGEVIDFIDPRFPKSPL